MWCTVGMGEGVVLWCYTTIGWMLGVVAVAVGLGVALLGAEIMSPRGLVGMGRLILKGD